MTDREKKIEEIRKLVNMGAYSAGVGSRFMLLLEEIRYLQSEYADERAAHNSHVTELCNAEAEVKRLQQEIKSHGPEGRNYTNQQYVALQQERDKAVEELKEAHRQMDNARLIISKLGVSL